MKVGDLVTLSAYGKRVKRTGWIKTGDVGIIKGTTGFGFYRVMWCNSVYGTAAKRDYKTSGSCWDWTRNLDRRDLKFAK